MLRWPLEIFALSSAFCFYSLEVIIFGPTKNAPAAAPSPGLRPPQLFCSKCLRIYRDSEGLRVGQGKPFILNGRGYSKPSVQIREDGLQIIIGRCPYSNHFFSLFNSLTCQNALKIKWLNFEGKSTQEEWSVNFKRKTSGNKFINDSLEIRNLHKNAKVIDKLFIFIFFAFLVLLTTILSLSEVQQR